MLERLVVLCACAVALLPAAESVAAQQPTVSPVSGRVEIQVPPDTAFHALAEGGPFPSSAVVRTGADGFALVRYADGSEVVVRPGSEVRIGGEAEEGVLVRVGKVLLRMRRLLTPGQERTHRTPTTVAAVRGTEFGLAVERSGRTRVFVFQGLVRVSNATLEGGAVDVEAGRMTEVGVGRPPSAPRAFAAAEFEGGASGEVERGEDRAVEAGQAPVALRWLAFADADLDALANPAYLADGPVSGVSVVGFGDLGKGGARVERDGRRTLDADDAMHRGLGQALGRASLGSVRMAAVALGGAGLDRAQRSVRSPGSALPDVLDQEERWKVAEGRLMAAWVPGRTSVGLDVAQRWSSIDGESALVDSPASFEASEVRSDITTLSLGVRRVGTWTTGLSVHHVRAASTTRARYRAELNTSVNAVEALARRTSGAHSLAGWVRLERTTGHEDRTSTGRELIYREQAEIKTARVGVGVGLAPQPGVVIGLDVAAGLADESAVQRDGTGRTLEDEEDLRLSASVHVGAQLTLTGPWRAEVSVLHSGEHVDRDFPVARAGTFRDARSLYGTLATAGVLYTTGSWTGRYALSTSPEAGRPWVHSLLLARSAP